MSSLSTTVVTPALPVRLEIRGEIRTEEKSVTQGLNRASLDSQIPERHGEVQSEERLRSSPRPESSTNSAASSTPSTPTSRRLSIALPKVPIVSNFLTLHSPKKSRQQNHKDSIKDKNEPSRFLGEGVSFKAKLIGILEVKEARGDRMCQDALADLKMAIRAAGEHKQRITINIAIDGLRLRDEKTSDCLYHHPVHKISFIAQDMTDTRAFGYIFGSPDTGHRFFGIKTDKAAGQVVVAMRDLFQVVFELKKKEIELAKQHIEQQQQQHIKYSMGKSLENLSYSKSGSSGAEASGLSAKLRATREDLRENGVRSSSSKTGQQTSEVIADLLDLEIELNSIQQGIHQMEKITPSDPFGPEAVKDVPSTSYHDPFEDSFSPPIPGTCKSSRAHPVLLPPPPTTSRTELLTTRHGRTSKRTGASNLSLHRVPISPPTIASPPPPPPTASSAAPIASSETWFDSQSDPLFGEDDVGINVVAGNKSISSTTVPTDIGSSEGAAASASSFRTYQDEVAASQFDVFTELDPLGTGKIKPYVDKKDFFQELKNPPKKVLKDLAGDPRECSDPTSFSAKFDAASPGNSTVQISAILSPPISSSGLENTSERPTKDVYSLDPFADTDPFGEAGPFVDENFAEANYATGGDPFDTCFADFTIFGARHSSKGEETGAYHGPLRVSLPPEHARAEYEGVGATLIPPPPTTSRRSSPTPSRSKSPRLARHASASSTSDLVRLPSPKAQSRASRRLAKQTTLAETRTGTGSQSPSTLIHSFADDERLSNSSQELTDIAPEPPPRPAAAKPPPLPPKRQQQSALSLKPPPRPPPTEHYDYINQDDQETPGPPLPVPIRRPKSRGSEVPRPRQQTSVELSNISLPPPPDPALVREERKQKSIGAAANLTLKQLTKMNINDLALSLHVSPGHLSKMTLHELAAFLAQASCDASPAKSQLPGLDVLALRKSHEYSTLNESLDEETFKADFDSNFANFPPSEFDAKSDSPFRMGYDKYAVFRELLEQDSEGRSRESTEVLESVNVDSKEEGKGLEDMGEVNAEQDENNDTLPRSDSAMAEEGRRGGEDEEIDAEEDDDDFEEAECTGPDKYAALREIISEPTNADESDKEDSITEVAPIKSEEDFNLLTLSRQQSESPDSPVQELMSVKEIQSIIESTILEEMASETASNPDDTLKAEQEISEELEPLEVASVKSTGNKTPSPAPVEKIDRVPPPSELHLADRKKSKFGEFRDDRWAKFDDHAEGSEQPVSNDDAASPWSLDGRDMAEKSCTESPDSVNVRSRRRHGSRHESLWQDDNPEDMDDPYCRENGGKDYERHPRGSRSRRRSPWGRGPPRRSSPWMEDDNMGETEYGEMGYKKSQRGTSGERRYRRPPSWEDEDLEYDEHRHVRRSEWINNQPDRDRRREYEECRRERSGSRGENIDRRAWERDEEENSRRQAGKYAGSYATWGERGSKKSSQERKSREASGMRRKQYDGQYWYYRDQRGSPVDYEYDEEEYPENYERSRYKGKKTGQWQKRPNSASDVRKSSVRRGYQSPGSSHSHEHEGFDEGFSERRYRTPSTEARGWTLECHEFNSDTEQDYLNDRVRETYEQRSHTLHSKRNQKQKRSRLSREEFSQPQKSPFEDDFSAHSFHASEFSSIDSPSGEVRKQEASFRKDSQISEQELKLASHSPMEELQTARGRESPHAHFKTTRIPSRRQSPFEDDFTPPETRRGSGRVPSSFSSDVSEQRRSSIDETGMASRTTNQSLSVRTASVFTDDVFLPTTSIDAIEPDSPGQTHQDKPTVKLERKGRSEDRVETSRPLAGFKSRPSALRSMDSNPNIKKSESVNIFARNNDPFDDDFFANKSPEQGRGRFGMTERPKKNLNTFSEWSEPFDKFDFKEED